jgi:hypothetical protein
MHACTHTNTQIHKHKKQVEQTKAGTVRYNAPHNVQNTCTHTLSPSGLRARTHVHTLTQNRYSINAGALRFEASQEIEKQKQVVNGMPQNQILLPNRKRQYVNLADTTGEDALFPS